MGLNDLNNEELQFVAGFIVCISLIMNVYFIANRHCPCPC